MEWAERTGCGGVSCSKEQTNRGSTAAVSLVLGIPASETQLPPSDAQTVLQEVTQMTQSHCCILPCMVRTFFFAPGLEGREGCAFIIHEWY